MILREDLYLHCRECVNNPLGNISIPHQIACCIRNDCLLYHERPIMVMDISPLMMKYLEVSRDLLCERTRYLD